jgi:hypothetical protein
VKSKNLGAFFFGPRAEKKPGFPLQSFLRMAQKRISAAIPAAWASSIFCIRVADTKNTTSPLCGPGAGIKEY